MATKPANSKLRAAKVGVLAAVAGGSVALLSYKVLQARKNTHANLLGSQAKWHESLLELNYVPEHFSQDEALFDMFGLVWMLSERKPESFHAIKQALLGLDSLMRVEYVLENKDAEPTWADLDRATALTTYIVHNLSTVKNLKTLKAYNALEATKTRIERNIINHTLRINSLVYDCD